MIVPRSNGMPLNIENAAEPNPVAPRRMLTVAAAAARIGVSPSKVYQLVAGRAIGHYRVGGKILFSELDVDAYLATCHTGAVAPAAAAPRLQIKLKHLRLS